jgi:hypothetical protein
LMRGASVKVALVRASIPQHERPIRSW